jgi:hypothetical protein
MPKQTVKRRGHWGGGLSPLSPGPRISKRTPSTKKKKAKKQNLYVETLKKNHEKLYPNRIPIKKPSQSFSRTPSPYPKAGPIVAAPKPRRPPNFCGLTKRWSKRNEQELRDREQNNL